MFRRCVLLIFAAAIAPAAGCAGKQPLSYLPLPRPALIESSPGEDLPLQGPRRPLAPGERYTYYVTWLGMNVASAVLSIDEAFIFEQDTYKVQLEVKTRSVFSLLCKVNGSVISYIRRDNYRPLYHLTDFHINKKHVLKKIYYDDEKKTALTEDAKGRHTTEITSDTLDPLGVLYYFRLNNLVQEDTLTLPVNGG
ncbi:MAG: DUF3108 domain-containing protein, partial [Candidatus Omnitrophica bacterium]|nr:DUF3108 domain-containing protein [Candidatus Omnitrophota bacterium]